MILNDLIDDVTQTISDQIDDDYWKGSRFEEMAHYHPDHKGKWGEMMLSRLLTLARVLHTWDGDKNTMPDDGVYDIKLHSSLPRLEVKCSARNSNTSFRHEGIYAERVWDYLAFVDVSYDCIYLTILPYDCLKDVLVPGTGPQHPDFKLSATLRDSDTCDYIFTLSQRGIERGIAAGHTFVIDPDASDVTALTDFITSKLT